MSSRPRCYLDHNATSPFSPKVLDWLKGHLPFANPSSSHAAGKAIKRDISQTKEFLFQLFSLPQEKFRLLFHSGASEGISTLIKGRASFLKEKGKTIHLFYLATDHSAVHNLVKDLEKEGHFVTKVGIDRNGDFSEAELEENLQQAKGNILINYTWANNETGVVHHLERIIKIKKKTNAFVHVDAAQTIGKIHDWTNLSPHLSAYTFSGHKFGALKGIGFSFVEKNVTINPFIRGGGQQEGLRSGTENTLGILSLHPALKDLKEHYCFKKQREGKLYIENQLQNLMRDQGEIAGVKHQARNGNTIYFILYKTKAQITSMALDMAGFDVSHGSACRSGNLVPGPVLMAMGYSKEQAKNAIRLSFSPFFSLQEAKDIWPSLEKVLARLV